MILVANGITGDEGYIGLTLFNKQITGFTVLGTNTIPFLQLGVPYDTLTDLQRGALDSRGGPDVATVTLQQQVNAPGNLELRGQEITWVQPLDGIIEGLGLTQTSPKSTRRVRGRVLLRRLLAYHPKATTSPVSHCALPSITITLPLPITIRATPQL